MKANDNPSTKRRGMTLYLCEFEFSSGEYGQIFNLLFYAKNTDSLERKVDRYLRNYYPDGLDKVDGYNYSYCGGEVMVEFVRRTEISTAQQLIDVLLVEN